MLDGPASKDHEARYLGTHVYKGTPIFAIIVGLDTFGCCERFKNEMFDVDPRSGNSLY